MKEYRIGEGAMDTYFGKENDCKLYMLKSNDGRNQEIWVKWDEWIRPKNIISEGSEMPHAVRELLGKWNNEINKIRNTSVTIDDTPSAEERIAAALEYQNLLNM